MRRLLLVLLLVAAPAWATKQERGSTGNMSMPWRCWQAEPDGSLDAADRVSLMGLGSYESPAVPVTTVQLGELGAVNHMAQARVFTLSLPFDIIGRRSVWVPGGASAVPAMMRSYRQRREDNARTP